MFWSQQSISLVFGLRVVQGQSLFVAGSQGRHGDGQAPKGLGPVLGDALSNHNQDYLQLFGSGRYFAKRQRGRLRAPGFGMARAAQV